jgi:hypothetical protein
MRNPQEFCDPTIPNVDRLVVLLDRFLEIVRHHPHPGATPATDPAAPPSAVLLLPSPAIVPPHASRATPPPRPAPPKSRARQIPWLPVHMPLVPHPHDLHPGAPSMPRATDCTTSAPCSPNPIVHRNRWRRHILHPPHPVQPKQHLQQFHRQSHSQLMKASTRSTSTAPNCRKLSTANSGDTSS